MSAGANSKKRVLIIGGTRFSGLYLFKELHDRVSMCVGMYICMRAFTPSIARTR
jgi:hypothetical protein